MTHSNPILYGPFAETTPSGQSGWIDETRQTIAERVHTMLNKLDGQNTFTYSIWRGDDPTSIIATRHRVDHTFIQATGSVAAMKIEVQLTDKDGLTHFYGVGNKDVMSQKEVMLPIGAGHSVRVFENELFTAEQAADAFKEFYSNNTLSIAYSLRELDLTSE